MDGKPVLRYAPSPTGPQHIGGLRTALYCYLMAKQMGGEFILRIEDTDQKRFVEGAEEFILKSAAWLGLEFTQGPHIGGPHAPYRQSERSALYAQFAQKLVESGHAYYAFDTSEELEEMRKQLEAAKAPNQSYNCVSRMSMSNSLTWPEEKTREWLDSGKPYVIRFKMPLKDEVRFQDLIRGWQHWHTANLDDKVLFKSDGLPTYHLANVVDDYHMGVSHVVRGEEWLSSTPLHVMLYKALGWESSMPQFAHLPLLLAPDGSKLSKRKADKYGIPIFAFNWYDKPSDSIWEGYSDLGYLPETLVNHIALLGWHPGGEQEYMSMEELIAAFSIERVHHAGAKFDMDKLKAFQAHYLRAKSDQELAELVRPHLEAAGIAVPDDSQLLSAVALMRERMTFAADMVKDGVFFFEDPVTYDEQMARKKWKGDAITLLADFMPRLEAAEEWTADVVHDLFHAYVTEKGAGLGKLMAPLRLALTGISYGPGCFDIAAVIGKTATLRRIQQALDTLGLADSQEN